MLHVLLALAFSAPVSPASLASTSIVMSKAGDAVATLTVNDAGFPAVTALDVAVDGEVKATVLIFGKVGHPPYTALLQTLPAGRHHQRAAVTLLGLASISDCPDVDGIRGARLGCRRACARAVASGRHDRRLD
jgi:hypothetical protein